MIFAIISGIICLIAGVILLTAYYNKVSLLLPVSVYLLFRGIWNMLGYLLMHIFPGNDIVNAIDFIVTAIIIGFFVFLLYKTKNSKGGAKKSISNAKRRETGIDNEFVIGIDGDNDYDSEFNKRQMKYWDDV